MRAGKRLVYFETVCIFPLVFATVKRNRESRNVRFEEESITMKEKKSREFFEHEGIGI